ETEVPQADIVILDSTFGVRRYCFPPEDEVVAGIIRFCEDAFARAAVPVLYAYSLGKAQEAAVHLGRHGIPAVLHPAALKLFDTYRRHGISLPEAGPLAGRPAPGVAVIYPPNLRTNPAV